MTQLHEIITAQYSPLDGRFLRMQDVLLRCRASKLIVEPIVQQSLTSAVDGLKTLNMTWNMDNLPSQQLTLSEWYTISLWLRPPTHHWSLPQEWRLVWSLFQDFRLVRGISKEVKPKSFVPRWKTWAVGWGFPKGSIPDQNYVLVYQLQSTV